MCPLSIFGANRKRSLYCIVNKKNALLAPIYPLLALMYILSSSVSSHTSLPSLRLSLAIISEGILKLPSSSIQINCFNELFSLMIYTTFRTPHIVYRLIFIQYAEL